MPDEVVTLHTGTLQADDEGELWARRIGRRTNVRKYSEPDILLACCIEYFRWAKRTPIKEPRLFSYMGDVTESYIEKPRPLTIEGLCAFLSITQRTWWNYRNETELSEVCEWVENIMFDKNFSLAAAELLNPSIISRQLGLADKQEVQTHAVIEDIEWEYVDDDTKANAAGTDDDKSSETKNVPGIQSA